MASVSLFRRWRSQKFADLVGQTSVVQTLQNVLVGDAPARAYLFCGPRGTGKTSSARIFAKALNCENGPALEPCDECSQCRAIAAGSSLDVFEIDAASHTQVDKIREFIVEKVHFSPISAKMKVYIIDEVHKLSTSSFNALLKTLEEPPSHVVFILATTHPHELPPTILSRCQRYDFRPLSIPEIRARLLFVAEAESVELDGAAADQLARAADGSLRDALVLFEQAVTFCGQAVTLDPVLELLGMVGYQVLEEMFLALHRQDSSALIGLLHSLTAQGRDLKRLANAFLEHLRLVMLLQVKAPDSTFEQMADEEKESLQRLAGTIPLGSVLRWLKAGMELTQEVREGRQAKLLWETTLVALANPGLEPNLAGLQARIAKLEAGGLPSPPATQAPAPPAPPPPAPSPPAKSKTPAPSKDPLEAPPEPDPVEEKVVPETQSPAAAEPLPPPPEPAVHEPEETAPTTDAEAPPEEPAPPSAPVETEPEAVETEPEVAEESVAVDPRKHWNDFLASVRAQDRRLHAMLSDAKLVELGAQSMVVGLPRGYTWHQQTILKSRSILEGVVASLSGRQLRLECVVEGEEFQPRTEPEITPTQSEPPPEPEEPEPAESVQVAVAQVAPPGAPAAPVAVKEAPAQQAAARPAPVEVPARSPEPKPAPKNKKEYWLRYLSAIREKDKRLHAMLADAKLVDLGESKIVLGLPQGYDWHREKIMKSVEVLEETTQDVSGKRLALECVLGEARKPAPNEEHQVFVERAHGLFAGDIVE